MPKLAVSKKAVGQPTRDLSKRSSQSNPMLKGVVGISDERALIQGLIDQSRDPALVDPAQAIAPAEEAFSRAVVLEDEPLLIDAILNLLNRLNRANRNDARDRLVAEWRGKITLYGTPHQCAILANLLSIIHLQRGEYGDALAELRPALVNPEAIDDSRLVTMMQINAGSSYSGLGIYDTAMSWFHKALKTAEILDDNSLRSYIHNNLGIIHRKLADQERAAHEFHQVVELAEKTNDLQTLASAYTNLSTVSFKRSEWDKSMAYSRKSLEINERIRNQYGVLACLTNMGMVFKELEEYDLAIERFEEALNIATSLDAKFQIANLLMNVAHLHFRFGNLNQAKDLLDKAMEIAEKIGAMDLQNDLYMAYTDLYEKTEDYPRAIEAYKHLLEIRSEVFQGKQRDIIEELHIRYQVESKEQETEAYRLKNQELEHEIQVRIAIEKELNDALGRIKVLTGLLPVCAECKKVRDEGGEWHQMEQYISKHSDAQFSHGYCPTCAAKALSDLKRDL